MSMDLLVGDIIRAAARSVGADVAVVLGDEQLTYRELDARSSAHARALRAAGAKLGDRVVLWADTAVASVALMLGASKLGVGFAPVSSLLGVEEAAGPLALVRPSVLVADRRHLAGATALAAQVGASCLALDDLDELGAGEGDVAEPDLTEVHAHALFFTSGSTGAAKAVVLSHRVNYLRSHPGAQLEPRGATICAYPLFHMGAWTIVLQALAARSTLVLVPSPSAADIGEAVQRWQATHLNAIPAVWERLLATPVDLGSLRVADSGTSATPPSLLEAIAAACPGAVRRVFYGSTEAGAVTLLRDSDMAARPGSCGTVQHSTELRLAPDTAELQVRGPLVFSEYFDDAHATAAAFTDDGWFRTGDVAVADADGFLRIVGRLGDLIRSGGEAVTPAEVEAVIAVHPAVEDVVVLGLPDETWGEVVCAAIVLAPGSVGIDLAELRSFLSDRLASFKHPRRVVVLEALDRTPATGQPMRSALRAKISAMPGSGGTPSAAPSGPSGPGR